MDTTPIAVLGGGAVGCAIACDCLLAGCTDVRLVMRSAASRARMDQIRTHGLTITGPQTTRTGFRREGTAHPTLVTDSVAEAVRGARLLLLCVPSYAQQTYFSLLADCLEDGMIVHIVPDNYGALRLRELLRQRGCQKRVIIGGWNCAPYGVRFVADAPTPTLRLVNRFVNLKAGAFPQCDQAEFLQSIARLPAFDCARLAGCIEGGDTILDVNFSNLNPMLHIPATVLGVGVMENYGIAFGTKSSDYSLFCHAMSPAIARVQQQWLAEQQAIAQAVGFTMTDYAPEEFFNRESVLASRYRSPEIYCGFDDPCPDQLGIGPPSVDHRFLTEDVPAACGVMRRLARVHDVATPLMDALCTLAEALVTDRSVMDARAITLQQLGLDGLRGADLCRFLRDGKTGA